ncbi:MAG: thioredoxin family protein [Pirellulales bacterium]|nr:thioredoxin family protein [Pirellulales bacterium]
MLCALSAGPAAAQIGPPQGETGGGLFGPSLEEKNPVDIEAQFSMPKGEERPRLFITADIQEGWHINSITQAPGGPLRTEITLTPSDQYRLAGNFQAYPEPKKEKEPEFYKDLILETHSGTVTWYAPLELTAEADPAKLRIKGHVTLQACDPGSCMRLELSFTAKPGRGKNVPQGQVQNPVSAVNPPPPSPATSTESATATPKASEEPISNSPESLSLGLQLGLAFVAGLILNLMPCVLPVISLKLLAFLKQGGESRLRVFSLNLWYSAGLLSVFMVLAALAGLAHLGWGEQFTHVWFKVALSALVFVMALSFLGVWQIPIPGLAGAGRVADLQEREGPAGAFFKGVFTTILATPCSGPFLGPILGYLLKQPPHVSFLVFGAIGLGMASPYLLIGAFPQLIRVLPKPGGWMKTLEEVMGFFLLGTTVYLLQTLRSIYFIPTATLLVGLWFACWLIGRVQFSTSPAKRLAAWCIGAVAAAGVGLLAFQVLLSEPKLPWRPFTPEALAQARAEGKTVMVDFTANWCPNCKWNSKWAIETEGVLEIVQQNGVVPLLADWTDHSIVIKKALNDLGYNSIPLLAVWPGSPSDKPPIVLPDLLSEKQVIDALEEAGPSKK